MVVFVKGITSEERSGGCVCLDSASLSVFAVLLVVILGGLFLSLDDWKERLDGPLRAGRRAALAAVSRAAAFGRVGTFGAGLR